MADRCWIRAGILLLALSVQAVRAPSALAEPAPRPDPRAATLFRDGRAAMAREDYVAACPRFEESAKIEPAPGTFLNLALCQEHLGQLAGALHSYNAALERLAPGDQRVPFAKEQAALLVARVARLTVKPPRSMPAGARVFRDGQQLLPEEMGVETAVDPGRHEIEVEIPGAPRTRQSVLLAAGEVRTVMLDEAAGEASEATATVGASSGGLSRRTVGYVVGGVGAASLTTSLILGGLVLGKKSTVDDECTATTCSPEGADAASAGRTLSTVSTVTFFAGLLGIGAGVYLVLTDSGAEKTAFGKARPRAATVVGPTFLPGGGTLSVWRQF
ncbi:tetratricopeptide repeat protein [Chondromyces apiculatus]|nr:hypothetical protein [Chondromyces apiculatus]